MLSSFDHVKLTAMLKDFYNLTHMRITVYDDAYSEITAFPGHVAPICRYIRSNPQADADCRECDMRACQQAKRQRSPLIYRCHAGLTEAIAPVVIDNEVIAYLSFGHQFVYADQESGRREIQARCAKYDPDRALLDDLICEMHGVDERYILSGVHIMEAVASYLCMERMITLKEQTFQAEIDQFVTDHFTEDISVDTLCRHFAVSRTALYAFAKQNYGVGIAQHIRDLRVQYAQELLISKPEMRISDIAEACGYSDYNYFNAVFSRFSGMPPRKYRLQNSRPGAFERPNGQEGE